MLSIVTEDKENSIKSYCQRWLSLLSTNEFVEAENLLIRLVTGMMEPRLR